MNLPAAKEYARKWWGNYFPGGSLAYWDSLPTYLKDDAIAATLNHVNLPQAQAFALYWWPNYTTWDLLPQYLKDDALASTALWPTSLDASRAYAYYWWPNYFTNGSPPYGTMPDWYNLPLYLKDESILNSDSNPAPLPVVTVPDPQPTNLTAAQEFAARYWPNYTGGWATLPPCLQAGAISETRHLGGSFTEFTDTDGAVAAADAAASAAADSAAAASAATVGQVPGSEGLTATEGAGQSASVAGMSAAEAEASAVAGQSVGVVGGIAADANGGAVAAGIAGQSAENSGT